MSKASFKQTAKPLVREVPVLKEHQLNIMENQENEVDIVEESANNHQKSHTPDQLTELQYQTIFLNLTGKLTDLSSKLNSLLTRVDGLESSLPSRTAANGFSRTFESTNSPNTNTASNCSNSSSDISKLNRICEGLSARMTVLETDVLLIKQVRFFENKISFRIETFTLITFK